RPYHRRAILGQSFSAPHIRQPDFDLGVAWGSCATRIAEVIKRIDETTILGVPCLTLQAAVTLGTNRVIGRDPRRIAPEVLRTLNDPPRPTALPPLRDGCAACRRVETLVDRHSEVGEPGRGL